MGETCSTTGKKFMKRLESLQGINHTDGLDGDMEV
jgi:hypothetical protein